MQKPRFSCRPPSHGRPRTHHPAGKGFSPYNQGISCKLIYKYMLKLLAVALDTSNLEVPQNGVS